MKNRIISILMTIVLVITLVPVSGAIVSAEETATSGTCGENLTWEFDSSTATLTISGTGEMTDFVYGKTAGWVEKKYKGEIEKIIINEGVTTIGKNAFASHSKLTLVELPQSLVAINGTAFQGCCKLTEITIPDGVTKIDYSVFSSCKNLRTITIGAGLETYGTQAFDGLENLSRFIVSPANKKFSSDTYGVLFDKEKTKLLQCPTQINQECYTIPDEVVTINNYAFRSCKNLKSIIVGNSVTTIGQWAFYECAGLTDVTIPISVTKIDKGAFSGCSNLKTVEFLGTEEEWSKITIGENNDALSNATINYGTDEHICTYNDADWKIEEYPNCVDEGKETALCTICNEPGYRSLEPTGIHDFGNWQTVKEATCTKYGEEERKCKWCEKTETKDTDMIAHKYGEWTVTTPPTCEKSGEETRSCICGKSEKRTVTSLDHKYGEWVITKRPTTNETGVEECKCSVCGNTKKRILPALENPTMLLGDVNGDAEVTAVDARLILQVVAELKTENDIIFENADVNDDEKITATDARIILRMVAELV